MVELEADDALASAARFAAEDDRVQKVCIWTPDKDLAQCVRGERVVQVDRKTKVIRDAQGVREKFGVAPHLIPDFLALVGDAADGYPGVAGIGKVTAARLVSRYGAIEEFPPSVLGERRELALLFKQLATSGLTPGYSATWTSCGGAEPPRASPRAQHGWEMIDCSPAASRLPSPERAPSPTARGANAATRSFPNSFWSR